MAVIETWEDSLLLKVSSEWIQAAIKKRSNKLIPTETFEDIKEALTSYMRQTIAKMTVTAKPFLDTFNSMALPLGVATTFAANLRNITGSPAMAALAANYQSIINNISPFIDITARKEHNRAEILAIQAIGQLGTTAMELITSAQQSTLAAAGRALSDSSASILAGTLFNQSLNSMHEIQKQGEQLAQAMRSIQNLAIGIDWSTQVLPSISSFFLDLPDLRELQHNAKEVREAGDLLEASGYGFSEYMWERAFLRGFLNAKPRARSSQMTKAFLTETQSDAFETQLKGIISGSEILKSRWIIIASALAAHRRRDFVASVPLLYTQIEGIYADALILKGEVLFQSGKLLYKGKDGKAELFPVYNRSTGAIKRYETREITGLRRLIDRSKLKDTLELEILINTALSTLNKERNLVLHRRNIK